ncbi:MAG: hypothetical protein GC145_08845 [Caulobacter sp.]|nr:hypothetical protein [Caulobacter sp.]
MTRKLIVSTLSGLTLVCAPAVLAAAPAAIAPAIGAAIVSTHPDGRTASLRLHADHSYDARGRDGGLSSGRWSMKDGKVCLSQKKPFPGLFRICKAFPRVAVGDSWEDTAFNGDKVTNRIVAEP